jgi:hypothetical protein
VRLSGLRMCLGLGLNEMMLELSNLWFELRSELSNLRFE